MNGSLTNILHLSDIHFGMESLDNKPTAYAKRKNALEGLVSTIKELNIEDRPQVIVITGDITWRGTALGFDQARIWINSLLEDLAVPKGNLIICPGNHDIDRDEAIGVLPPQSSKDADKWLSIEHYNKFIRPFHKFMDFSSALDIPTLKLHNDESNRLVGYRDVENLRFLVMNSAWFSRGNEDRGKLWLGLPQLEVMTSDGVLDRKNDLKPTIALVHHPKEWFHDEEQNTYANRPSTYRYLAERCHIILSGHVHGSIEKPSVINDSSYLITGGASYAGENYRNNFSILKVDSALYTVTQIPFEYDPGKDEWNERRRENFSLKKKII
ncbi:metallophosphoesterase [Paenibacillus xylanexedens]|uniref:metallophosphoesterase family protein n=1 Tax=Paenibacillus xylanexedens TaxID=528191 RepID=UPI0011A24ED0|nr:metallophosphoesterase [Paenibacillus xylanexedens]